MKFRYVPYHLSSFWYEFKTSVLRWTVRILTPNLVRRYSVRHFEYDGLSCEMKDGLTSYWAEFTQWTVDPGVGKFYCSDDKFRSLPTCVVVGWKDWHQKAQPQSRILFGPPSQS